MKEKLNDALSDAPLGQYVCTGIDADGDTATRMKQLGICTGRSVTLIASGDPLIVRLGSNKVGLSRELAQRVLIERRSEASVANA